MQYVDNVELSPHLCLPHAEYTAPYVCAAVAVAVVLRMWRATAFSQSPIKSGLPPLPALICVIVSITCSVPLCAVLSPEMDGSTWHSGLPWRAHKYNDRHNNSWNNGGVRSERGGPIVLEVNIFLEGMIK